ncbi:MAG: 7-cyano-7-deazaguanine synthase [Bacteroidales bacterium]|jgi:7-cyano-7-deazaguanine synthase|nr:7-cyano-7-deazaguanine synthase [Bacteroidales bacterium]
MKLVTLVSGGIDSTLMSVLAKDQNFELYPLFVDYGQLGSKLEWEACVYNHNKHKLPSPMKMSVRGFGNLIHSGLTDKKLRIREDAFLPGRNTLFLLAASSYAYQVQSKNIAIGLLTDQFKLFPDQSKEFIEAAEKFISMEMDYEIKILTPLMEFNKAEVIELAKSKNINKTYSCHSGNIEPCGICISCLEIKNALQNIKYK